MNATELVGSHKKKNRFLELHESKSKSVKRFKWLTVLSIYFVPKLVHTFHVFNVDIKKLCLLCSQKLTDKYSQTVVGWCKESQFICPQFFVVIGMVDLIKI